MAKERLYVCGLLNSDLTPSLAYHPQRGVIRKFYNTNKRQLEDGETVILAEVDSMLSNKEFETSYYQGTLNIISEHTRPYPANVDAEDTTVN